MSTLSTLHTSCQCTPPVLYLLNYQYQSNNLLSVCFYNLVFGSNGSNGITAVNEVLVFLGGFTLVQDEREAFSVGTACSVDP
jgi:hypothetical protein